MKDIFVSIPLNKNESEQRFELVYEQKMVFIEYEEQNNKYYLTHTEADPALKGTGAANAIAEKTLSYIKEQGATVLPYCPFVYAFIQKNAEWQPLVDKSFQSPSA